MVGLSLGFGSKTQKSTSSGTFDKTTMPVNPAWATGLSEQLAGMIGNLGGANPWERMPGSNSLLDTAKRNALSLGGYSGPDYFAYGDKNADVKAAWDTMAPETKAAMGLTSADDYYAYHWDNFGKNEGRELPKAAPSFGQGLWESAQGALEGLSAAQAEFVSGLKYLDDWMNPYRKEVVDVLVDNLDHQAGKTREEMNLALNGRDAYSGSGAALTVAATEDALTRARSTALAEVLDRMFNQSAGYALTDAGNENQVNISNAQLATQAAIAKAQGLGSLAANRGQFDLSSAGLQAELGDFFRGIEKEQNFADFDMLERLIAMLGGMPIGELSGEHSWGNETATSKGKSSGFELGFTYGGKS